MLSPSQTGSPHMLPAWQIWPPSFGHQREGAQLHRRCSRKRHEHLGDGWTSSGDAVTQRAVCKW